MRREWLTDCFYAVFGPFLLVLTVAAMALWAFGPWPYVAALLLYAVASANGAGGLWSAGLSFVAGYGVAWVLWWLWRD